MSRELRADGRAEPRRLARGLHELLGNAAVIRAGLVLAVILLSGVASAQTSGVSCEKPGHTLVVECRAAQACDTGELIAASKELLRLQTNVVISGRSATWSAVGIDTGPCRDPQTAKCLMQRAAEAEYREKQAEMRTTAEARWRKSVEACSR